jgi:antitoxin (DNA-binding transcriptional repressor) of toxin-antitoxin stability system
LLERQGKSVPSVPWLAHGCFGVARFDMKRGAEFAAELAMGSARRITAEEFKATCLDLLDRVASGEVPRVEVTQEGKVVAVLGPPASDEPVQGLHGSLRGRVIIPPGFDLTAPVCDETWDAELGILHR